MQNKQDQVDLDKVAVKNPNTNICFKNLNYSVTESSGCVSVTIEKHCAGDFTFKIQTKDDTAIAPTDYISASETITMKDGESEHTFKVEVINDAQWEPDKDFLIELLDAETGTNLPGDDCVCTVTILDEDRPGNIGFRDRFLTARRKDKVMYVYLERKDGSDGDISCLVKTTAG